ncbi:hypothetical protein CLAIMM_07607 [Cladophialophora immunda]|nr:hypothetical protein CLAIMM_07607 [Cladophialophora immunda]
MALQDDEIVLGIIGCGKMATAVLEAVFRSTGTSRSPLRKVLASVRSPESQARLKTRFAARGDAMEVLAGNNTRVAEEANVVLLGHKPYMLDSVLGAAGLSNALRGKLIISILAGISKEQIHERLYGAGEKSQAFILLAVPNMGAQVQESMTVIAEPSPDVPSKLVQQTTWLFERAGKVAFVAPSLLNLSNVLVASCIALTTIGVDGILDAAVMEGMPRSQAQQLASQCLVATGKLLGNGSHPAELRESISSPKGCTIRAITQLEKLGARSAFTEAIKAGTDHIKIMGSLQDPPR